MKESLYGLLILGVATQVAAVGQTPSPGFDGVYVASAYVNVPVILEPEVYPFTDQGRRSFQRFDRFATPNQLDDCAPVSMPSVIFDGDPMEILEDGPTLVFHYERSDTRRTIHMNGPPPRTDQPRTRLGYSIGRWVGNDELVIETTHLLDSAIRINEGHPLSRDARLTERYRREPGDRNLAVELLVDDPTNYAEPVALGRELVYSLEDEVRSWGCVDLGPKDEAPDIDELVRMLEQR